MSLCAKRGIPRIHCYGTSLSALPHQRSAGLPINFINSIPIGRRAQLGADLHMKVHLDIKNGKRSGLVALAVK